MKLINEREGTVIEEGSLVDDSLTLEDQSSTKSSITVLRKSKRNQRVKFWGSFGIIVMTKFVLSLIEFWILLMMPPP